MMPTRPRCVLICGDREWKNYPRILACVQKANLTERIDVIIVGDCHGADRMAGCAAIACGITVQRYPALWNKHGKAAGPIRNQQMLDEGKPTEVWAFHNDIMNSRDTRDMLKRAMKAELSVTLITETGWFRDMNVAGVMRLL